MAPYLSDQQKNELAAIAQKILTPGKGILAADESTGKLTFHSSANRQQNKRQTSTQTTYTFLVFHLPRYHRKALRGMQR